MPGTGSLALACAGHLLRSARHQERRENLCNDLLNQRTRMVSLEPEDVNERRSVPSRVLFGFAVAQSAGDS